MTEEIRSIRADVTGEIVLYDLPPKTLERVRLKLSLPNPKFASLKRFHGHTGAEPERIYTAIEMPDGSLHCPRGCVDLLRTELFRDGLAMKVTRDGRRGGAPITVRPKDYLPARDYQQEGVDKLRQHTQGLVVLPCGTGKTKLGGYGLLALRVTTLVLVHTTDLADQWLADFEAFGFDAGLVGSGKDERNRDVVVGIVDSVLAILESPEGPAWGDRFGFWILDECHHAPADTFQRAARLLPARYRLGLTATPTREDGLTRMVDWTFGRTLLERETSEMIRLGYLMPATIEIIATGFTWALNAAMKEASFTESAKEQAKLLIQLEEDVSTDLARNCLIADRIADEAKKGETCLVLVRTRAHAKELAEMISIRGVEARALTGKVSKKKRKGAIDDLRGGTLPVVVATSLADEGLDLPRLSLVGLASPQRARGTTVQRLGRLLRLWDKKPRLLDWVDDEVDCLASRATARRRVYRDTKLMIQEVTT